MTASRFVVASLAVAFFLIVAPHSAMAQNAGGQNNGGQGRQRGNFDPAAARERQLTRIKEQLAATDDEWKVLQPKIEALMTAQRDARAGGRGQGGRGGRNRNGQNQDANAQTPPADQSAVAKASADLRAAVADKSTPPEELAKKLAALRDAKAKALAARAAAQKDVKDLLTARQEAVLVQMGMLE